MATHIRNIPIKAYTTPNGEPTCRTAEGWCLFCSTIKFGTIEWCAFNHTELQRQANEKGEQ